MACFAPRRTVTEQARAIATDKFASYYKFKEYYKRDVCVNNLKPNKNVEHVYDKNYVESNLEYFISHHDRFIVKPLDANSGKGIKIISRDDYRTIEELKEELILSYQNGFIVEELIISDPKLSSFHPKSVNTIRINTFLYKDNTVEIKYPCFRIGRGSAVVDNANSGGIAAAIDVESGKTIAAADEMGNSYTNHPDTGLSLIDFEIPQWEEACSLVQKLAKEFKECKIIGWDLALTEKGWVLVEVNAHPLLIYQIATQKGIKEEMVEMSKKI